MKLVKPFVFLALIIALVFVLAPASEAKGPKGLNLVDVALIVNGPGSPYEGQFDTLITAVLAADPAVVATLTGNGQHTALSQDALTQILLYHVANGRRDSGDVVSSSQIRTLQRGFFQVDGTTLTDNLDRDAKIIVTDVPAANGLIHAIDAVLLPFAP